MSLLTQKKKKNTELIQKKKKTHEFKSGFILNKNINPKNITHKHNPRVGPTNTNTNNATTTKQS